MFPPFLRLTPVVIWFFGSHPTFLFTDLSMTEKNEEFRPQDRNGSGTGVLIPVIFSFILLELLFPIPGPDLHVNQPFKVELLLAFFVIFLIVFGRRTVVFSVRKRTLSDRAMRMILIPIGTFVLLSKTCIYT